QLSLLTCSCHHRHLPSFPTRRSSDLTLLDRDKIRAVGIINRIAAEVGQHYEVLLQLNFPPGREGPRVLGLGHRDLSMLVYRDRRSEEHTSELQSRFDLVCRLLLEKKK